MSQLGTNVELWHIAVSQPCLPLSALPPRDHPLPPLQHHGTSHYNLLPPPDPCAGCNWPVQLTQLCSAEQHRKADISPCLGIASFLGSANVPYDMLRQSGQAHVIPSVHLSTQDCAPNQLKQHSDRHYKYTACRGLDCKSSVACCPPKTYRPVHLLSSAPL